MSSNPVQIERRRFPRISANFSLEVSPSDSGVGQGMDVSQGGVQFSHKGKLESGQIINLTLRVNGFSGIVSVTGRVIRCDHSSGDTFNVAANFVNIDKETETSIIEMLQSF